MQQIQLLVICVSGVHSSFFVLGRRSNFEMKTPTLKSAAQLAFVRGG